MKREGWVILLAFLGGIVFANMLEKELLVTYGILNDFFLSQYSYQMIDGNRLFYHVGIERCKTAFIIFLLGRVLNGRAFSVFIKSAVAATFGFLMVVAIVNLGVRGIAVCICGLFPQWLFYMATLFYYANCRREEEQEWGKKMHGEDISAYAVRWGLLAFGMLLGIAAESYLNPILLSYVLKIF